MGMGLGSKLKKGIKSAGRSLEKGIRSAGRKIDKEITQPVVQPVKKAAKDIEDYTIHGGAEKDVRNLGRKIDREITRPVVDAHKKVVEGLVIDPIKKGLGAIGGALGLGGQMGGIPSLPGAGDAGRTPSLTNPDYQTPMDLSASGLMNSVSRGGRTSTLVAGLTGFEEDDENLRKNKLGR